MGGSTPRSHLDVINSYNGSDMNTEEKITQLAALIKNKKSGSIIYQGNLRVFSPYLLGVTDKDRVVLQAYQFGGVSSKGPVTPQTGGWRYFYLDEIEEVNSLVSSGWYPEDFQKSEGEYKLPKFIVKVLEAIK